MASREQIIKRASEMIAELGVKSLRVDDLAQDLAISKRTLYEIFTDKEELLYHSIKYLLLNEAQEVQESSNLLQSGIPTLFEVFDAMVARSAVRKRIMELPAPRSQRLWQNMRRYTLNGHLTKRLL